MALLLLVAALVACSWLAPLDAAADRKIDAGLKRALVSFAVARALNAIISVAQGTQVSLQPMGVGVSLSVGQVLDPVHDVIEKFSTLMLIASVAFGVQKVLLAMGGHWLVSLLLTLAAGTWAILLVRHQRAAPAQSQARSQALSQGLAVLLLIRFAIPVVTLGSDAVFQQFLARDYQASQRILDRTSVAVEKTNPPAAAVPENAGLLDRMKNWAAAQNTAWKESLDGLKQAAEQATEHVIKLMVSFLLQTLVVPLGLLWMLVGLMRGVMRSLRL